MTATLNHAERLAALLKRLAARRRPAPPAVPADPDPIHHFLYSYLLWECAAPKADLAKKRIDASVVDVNELRVSLPAEIAFMLGERYPRVEERAARMRASLNDVYQRFHAVTLEPLVKMNKREARQILDSLEGVPQYVAARTMLLGLGGHAIPLDDRTLAGLVAEEVMEADATVEKAASIMERHIKAADALEAHLVLQAWSETLPPTPAPRRPSGRQAGGRSRSASTGAPSAPATGATAGAASGAAKPTRQRTKKTSAPKEAG